MKKFYKFILNNKKNKFLQWPLFIIYYLIIRAIFGIDYTIIYIFTIVLILLQIGFELCALIFFIIGMIVYILGSTVEANHYMSFVYGFLGLSMLRYLYFIIKNRFSS